MIDEVRMYDYVRTDEQILADYNGADAIAAWRLAEWEKRFVQSSIR